MSTKRKVCSAEFKAKLVLEVLEGKLVSLASSKERKALLDVKLEVSLNK